MKFRCFCLKTYRKTREVLEWNRKNTKEDDGYLGWVSIKRDEKV